MTDPISTGSYYDAMARNMTGLKERLSELGKEVTTKKKADLATSEPGAARTAWALRHDLDVAKTEISTADTAMQRAKIAEETLGSIKETAQSAREAMLQAPTEDGEYGFGKAAQQAQASAGAILSRLNTDVAGTHLFGGTETGQPPMKSIGSESDSASPIGMVRDHISNMLNNAGNVGIGISKVDDYGDALRVVSKGTVTALAQNGESLSTTDDAKLRWSDTDEVAGKIHVDKEYDGSNKRDRLTIALSKDFEAPKESRELEFSIKANEKKLDITKTVQSGDSVSDVVSKLETAINNSDLVASSGGSTFNNKIIDSSDVGTTNDGLDAIFRDQTSSNTDKSYTGNIYQGATAESSELTTQVDGKAVQYGARGDSTAMRDIIEGLLIEAVVDKTDRPNDLERQDNPADEIPENDGVNAMRQLARERLADGIDNLIREQGRLGIAQRQLEDAKAAVETRKDLAETRINQAENIDRPKTIAELEETRNDLRVTYKTTSRLQQLSLAQYI